MAAYAYHAAVLGYEDETVNAFFYKALSFLGFDLEMGDLLPVVLEVGEVNLKCMELLDRANTETFGNPEPTKVPLTVEKGPFIIITGHDLYDLKLLLEQTKDKGINVYTHGEMLPAHAYPLLKQYPHLKGNFGTAWQNQQKEFDGVPAPILYTTNCPMPVKESYRDRVFTTEVVSYPQMVHIGADKDFTPVIEKALELGGYKGRYGVHRHQRRKRGDDRICTRHGALRCGSVVDAVKSGAIRHFFLVGGCDGARPGRNYYTEFVKQTPKDSVILTLACGKYRFNDLDLGGDRWSAAPDGYGTVQRCVQRDQRLRWRLPRHSAARSTNCRYPWYCPGMSRRRSVSFDAAASGHPEHQAGTDTAGVYLPECVSISGGALPYCTDHNSGGRLKGDSWRVEGEELFEIPKGQVRDLYLSF